MKAVPHSMFSPCVPHSMFSPTRHLVLSPTFSPTFSLSELHLEGPHCLKYVYLGRKSLVHGDVLAGANPPAVEGVRVAGLNPTCLT